jgi:hypothetical protein
VLDVGLDDLFDVRAVRVDEQREPSGLEPAASRRMAELFDRQARGTLSDDEAQELEQLVGEYGRRLHEQRLREIAEQRGISLEAARREVSASLDQALAWWREFERDPANRAARARPARRRSRRRSGA